MVATTGGSWRQGGPLLSLIVLAVIAGGCGRFGFTRDASCGDGLCPGVDGGLVDATIGADGGQLDGEVGVNEAGAMDAAPVDGGEDASLPPLRLEPVYPLHGADWNAYVRISDPAEDSAHQADLPCDPAVPGDLGCVHGGERLKIEVPDAPTCSGVGVETDAPRFVWRCDARTGHAVLISTRLAPGVGLGDLIDASTRTFKPIELRVRVGGASRAVSATPPWANPIMEAPLNALATDPPITLDGSVGAAIYVVSTSRTTSGYVLASDEMSLVVMPGITLTYSDANMPSCFDGATVCLVAARDAAHVWIEGKVSAGSGPSSAHSLVELHGVRYGVVRKVRALGGRSAVGGYAAIVARETVGSRFEELSMRPSCESGLVLGDGSHFNRIYDVRVSLAPIYSFHLSQRASNNVVRRVSIHGSGNVAVWNYGRSNVIAELTATSGSGNLYLGPIQPSVATHITAVNSFGAPVIVRSDSSFVQAAVIDAPNALVDLARRGNTIANLAFGHSDGPGLTTRPESISNGFHGHLVSGGHVTVDCNVPSDGSAGVDPACGATGMSTSSPLVRVDLSGTFVDVVADAVNGSDVPAGVLAQNVPADDWLDFESPYRAWRRAGSLFDPAARGRPGYNVLQVLADWRLRATDTALRGRNGVFRPGMACPESVRGDAPLPSGTMLPVTLDVEGLGGDGDGACEMGESCVLSRHAFLVNALEVLGDDLGNEDSLCNSNEACIFSPNIGSYQGEGDYEAAGPCTFVDGAGMNGIRGVTMYGYPINGL